jgi:uncharacterized protein (TIGR02996 family)
MLDVLLDAARDNPDDDLPRLALADWCMEQPDPVLQARGEFIQIQCQLAGHAAKGDERRQLRDREQALLGEHRADWLGPLEGRLVCEFERGLVRACLDTASIQPLLGLKDPAAWRWLVSLNAVKLGRDMLPPLAAWPVLGRLAELDLTGNFLQDADVIGLVRSGQLSCLRRLSLADNVVRAEGAEALAGSAMLAGLRSLDLGRNILGPAGARALAAGRLVHLQELDLRLSGIMAEGARALLASPLLGRLKRLNLRGNGIRDGDVEKELRQRLGDGVIL